MPKLYDHNHGDYEMSSKLADCELTETRLYLQSSEDSIDCIFCGTHAGRRLTRTFNALKLLGNMEQSTSHTNIERIYGT